MTTNVTSYWDTGGDLIFSQAPTAWNHSGPTLVNISGAANGIHAQFGTTAVATTNGLALNANFYLAITDNTGSTYYLPIADALW